MKALAPHKKSAFLTICFVALLSIPQSAAAVSDLVTRVEVTSIATVGALNPTPLSPARIFAASGAVFAEFPVTSVAGDEILHSGGLNFSTSSASLDLENFLIDLDQGQLVAQVGGVGASDFPLFNIAPSSVADAQLQLTPEAISALDATFGVQLPDSFVFGEATVATSDPPSGGFAHGAISGRNRLAPGGRGVLRLHRRFSHNATEVPA